MLDEHIFEPKEETFTEIYDIDDKLIERLDGIVYVRPADYADQLPVKYYHIKVVTQVLNVAKIDKP